MRRIAGLLLVVLLLPASGARALALGVESSDASVRVFGNLFASEGAFGAHSRSISGVGDLDVAEALGLALPTDSSLRIDAAVAASTRIGGNRITLSSDSSAAVSWFDPDASPPIDPTPAGIEDWNVLAAAGSGVVFTISRPTQIELVVAGESGTTWFGGERGAAFARLGVVDEGAIEPISILNTHEEAGACFIASGGIRCEDSESQMSFESTVRALLQPGRYRFSAGATTAGITAGIDVWGVRAQLALIPEPEAALVFALGVSLAAGAAARRRRAAGS